MAFVVEDGTGLVATANAYISVAEMKAYFADRSPISASVLTGDIEKAIVIATDYINLVYDGKALGFPLVETQPNIWPTDWDVDNPLPIELKNACAEFANYALTEDLFFRPSYDESGKVIEHTRDQIGPISTEVTYSGSGVIEITKKKFPKAEKWIKRITANAQGGVIR